jgi:hypothetical protein
MANVPGVNEQNARISIPTANVTTQTSFSVQLFMKGDASQAGGGQVYLIGTAQDCTPTQTRSATPVGGVGFGDYIKELVAGRSSYTLKVTKTSMWTKSIQELGGFSPDVRMLAQMQAPIQIYQFHYNPSNPTDIRQSTYVDCILTDWSRPQKWDDNTVIYDELTFKFRKIDSGNPDIDIADVASY